MRRLFPIRSYREMSIRITSRAVVRIYLGVHGLSDIVAGYMGGGRLTDVLHHRLPMREAPARWARRAGRAPRPMSDPDARQALRR